MVRLNQPTTCEGTSSMAGGGRTDSAPSPTSLADVEREHIVSTLKQTGGVIEGPKGAATILNLHPNTLRSRIKKLGIAKPAVRRNL